MPKKNWYPCDEVGIVLAAGIGKTQFYGRRSLKTIDEFSQLVVEMYDEMWALVEEMEDTLDIGPSELMCVLTNMLCDTAQGSGVRKEVFMQMMEINYDVDRKKCDDYIEEGTTVH
tara:strand:+ start:1286 stop:1630 length:345 start_codon:yes stop_codon:yes gene_type:complete